MQARRKGYQINQVMFIFQLQSPDLVGLEIVELEARALSANRLHFWIHEGFIHMIWCLLVN